MRRKTLRESNVLSTVPEGDREEGIVVPGWIGMDWIGLGLLGILSCGRLVPLNSEEGTGQGEEDGG